MPQFLVLLYFCSFKQWIVIYSNARSNAVQSLLCPFPLKISVTQLLFFQDGKHVMHVWNIVVMVADEGLNIAVTRPVLRELSLSVVIHVTIYNLLPLFSKQTHVSVLCST